MEKIKKILFFIRCLIPSLYFNFKYLPFRQAIKLPILVYKLHFHVLKGKVVIDAPKIYTGMIRLGIFAVGVYPNNGISLKHEGMLIFKGKCRIGNDCHIVCGKLGKIVFGEDFKASAGMKIVSQCGITFGKEVRVGWGGIIIDTNFHPLYDMEKKRFKKAFGKIHIGDNNWMGLQCLVMPGVVTPERCIFGARTVITRGGNYEPYCVHGGSPIRVLSRNAMRIIGQDQIKDYSDTSLMIQTESK